MNTRTISGSELEQMIKNGLAQLQTRETEINRLNVFPVSDGDTGTNMRLTLAHGIGYARPEAHAGAYLKRLSEGMLLGARGNSGVILSQFFKGFYTSLAPCAQLDAAALCDALTSGYEAAYHAVVKPAEGTILTVTREGIEHIRPLLTPDTDVERLLALYIEEMDRSLLRTPELLPVLKEAGVVDSGALGFIAVADGMLKWLRGETVTADAASAVPAMQMNFDLFDENSAFEDGYCMEFILQLMNAPQYSHEFSLADFIRALEQYGESIVAVRDGMRVKVHIHTLTPAEIIVISQRYGEFLTFKLENMQVQHNEHDKQLQTAKQHKLLAVVAVVNGEGMKRLFTELGCDVVIDGGATMNTSSQEFIDAFAQLDADAVVVLPNNANVILAAEQAVALSGADNITVLPSKSMAEGYFAIAMDVRSSEDVAFRLHEMRDGLRNTVTLSEATASRDYADSAVSCKQGDEILLLNNRLVCVGLDPVRVILDGLEQVEDMDDRETCMVFRGADTDAAQEEALRDAIEERWPLLEVEFVDGGMCVYHWMLGLA